MWERRKEPASAPQQVPPARPETPSSAPMPAASGRTAEPLSPRGCATIGKAVTIKGEIYSEEDLYIDGNVEGTLELKDSRLTVGPNGKAQSNIKAREVVIQGSVRGDVDAKHKITIRKDGNLVGDIRTSGIIIEDDAYFKGSIDIVKKDGDTAAS
ncbi:MAG: bactofilin family protein [Bryobacteraceae bacterium]